MVFVMSFLILMTFFFGMIIVGVECCVGSMRPDRPGSGNRRPSKEGFECWVLSEGVDEHATCNSNQCMKREDELDCPSRPDKKTEVIKDCGREKRRNDYSYRPYYTPKYSEDYDYFESAEPNNCKTVECKDDCELEGKGDCKIVKSRVCYCDDKKLCNSKNDIKARFIIVLIVVFLVLSV